MEAVGSAATIVQLVSFTGEVLVLGYGYVNRVKKAPSEIRALLRETATLNALLDQLLDLAGSSSENGSFDGALQTLGRLGVFDDCEKLMKVIERNVKACEEVEGERVRNTGRRMAWPFKDKETKDLMVQLGRLREALSAAVMVDSAKSLKELEATAGRVERGVVDALDGINNIKSTTNANAKNLSFINSTLEENLKEEERSAIQKWLCLDSVETEAHFNAALSQKAPDTGEWLLVSKDFNHWLLHPHGCMWLYGIAGCGKTVLSATTIHHLRQQSPNDAVLYFFCDHRDPGKQSIQNLLHVIMKQLLELDDGCLVAADSWRKQKQPAPKLRPSSPIQPLAVSEYIELLCFLFRRWERVYLVVDAVDECDDLNKFVNGLQSLIANSDLQLFLTSRHDIELIQAISLIATTKMAAADYMEADILLYLSSEVEARVAQKALKLRQNDLSLLIVEALRKNADGMILIAKLQLDYVCGLKSDRAIKEALAKLPSGVYATYDEILRQLCTKRPNDIEDMRLILQWLQYSMVPLTLPQIAEAISIRPGDKSLDESGIATDLMDLASSLGSLVTIYTQDTTRSRYSDLRGPTLTFLSPAHYSVEEYLRSGQMDPTLAITFQFDPKATHDNLAKICLQYIGFEDFSEPIEKSIVTIDEDRIVKTTLRKALGTSSIEKQIALPSRRDIKDVTEIMGSSPQIERLQLRERTLKYPFYDYACRYWARHLRLSLSADVLDDEATHLLDWFMNPSHPIGSYISWQQMYHRDIVYYCPFRPPLYYAIEFGIDALVSLLLQGYEHMDFLANGVAPLHVAARCGALDVVQKLLDLGASVNFRSSKDSKGMTSLMTPLHFSAEGGHPDVTKLLLDNGADPHLKNESGSTPFSRAARSGSLRTLKLLYDAGSDINTHKRGITPLFEALVQCRPRVACQLLYWGADYRIAKYPGDSPTKFLQRTRNSIKQNALSYSNPYGDEEVDWREARKDWATEEDICEQIEAIRKEGSGPEAFMPLMKGLKREYYLLKQIEKDTRPGTEREKDYRYPSDPTKIVTNSEFCDREGDPFSYDRSNDTSTRINKPCEVAMA